MKKILAVSAAAIVAQVGLAAPASADTVALPYGGTATLTVPDVTLPLSGCITHYGSFSITHTAYWNVDIEYTGPTTYPVGDYLYGTGPQSDRVVEFLMCASSDQPGVYTARGLVTVEDPNAYNQLEAFVTDQFVVAHATPPPPPPPAPVYSDVTGTVAKKMITDGVKFTFKSKPTPSGTVTGDPLKWVVKYDGRRKKITQGPAEVDKLTLRFKQGKHVVKVFRNGAKVMTATVRA